MYKQERFRKESPEFIFDFMNRNPFATMVMKKGDLLATHIPLLAEGSPEDFRLSGHIAHNNEQFPYLTDEIEVLVIFQGAEAYISSSWYGQKDISTWNYSAVHINARIRLQNQEELRKSLEKLVFRFEKGQENPLFYQDIPQKMVEDHLPLIKGFWCEPYKIQAIAKLSQGQEEEVSGILRNLNRNPLNSQLVRDIKKEHFPKKKTP